MENVKQDDIKLRSHKINKKILVNCVNNLYVINYFILFFLNFDA